MPPAAASTLRSPVADKVRRLYQMACPPLTSAPPTGAAWHHRSGPTQPKRTQRCRAAFVRSRGRQNRPVRQVDPFRTALPGVSPRGPGRHRAGWRGGACGCGGGRSWSIRATAAAVVERVQLAGQDLGSARGLRGQFGQQCAPGGDFGGLLGRVAGMGPAGERARRGSPAERTAPWPSNTASSARAGVVAFLLRDALGDAGGRGSRHGPARPAAEGVVQHALATPRCSMMRSVPTVRTPSL